MPATMAALALCMVWASPAAAQRSSASGWVGMSVIQNGRGGGSAVALDYPVIASVEPGSPAQAAGLAAGDTVLAYNDVDAQTDPLAVQRFLRPGERLLVKVRRNGVRLAALTVARRSARNAYRVNITVADGRAADAVGPLPATVPFAPSREAAFAGAQIARLNAGLASVLNVRDVGVLVLEVVPGTPAMRSGLQPGDVILRADTTVVHTPLDLLGALHAAPDHTVLLELSRKGKPQKLTLRW